MKVMFCHLNTITKHVITDKLKIVKRHVFLFLISYTSLLLLIRNYLNVCIKFVPKVKTQPFLKQNTNCDDIFEVSFVVTMATNKIPYKTCVRKTG